jgi:UDP-N-acetylglucosamine--N-acetylmuramyl-(pentapeptide) pyrophosphoryl-undecaprenol N-acetylglucosamine transferase
MKILITGGHLTPALALIDELEKEKDLKLFFVGRKHPGENSKNISAEYTIINKKNIKFFPLTTGRLQRKFTKYTLTSLLKIPLGFFQSFYYLLLQRPNIVVSFGGYISPPVVAAAWLLGIPSVTHEQSILPGLANKINAIFVKKVYLTWTDTKKYFKNAIVIGNPTRKVIFNKETQNEKVKKFAETSEKLIYVTGGNQGSHFINNLIFDSLEQVKGYKIIHQVGSTNHNGDLDKALRIKNSNYLALAYVEDDCLGYILNNSSIVISRSGANTVWELAILGKPSILIPLPISASGEQQQNANILKSQGSAIVLEQKSTNPKILLASIKDIEKNLTQYQKNAQDLKKTLPINSANVLKEAILKLI